MVPLDKKISWQHIPTRDEFKGYDDSSSGEGDDIPTIRVYRDLLEDKELIKAKDTKTGEILHSETDAVGVIQKSLEILSTASRGLLSIDDGYYQIESNNIILPDMDNLSIEGNSPAGNAIFDARNINTPGLRNPRYVGIISRSTEDSRNNRQLNHVNNLNIRNLSFIGSQTGERYLADDLSIDGLRINNVDNLLIENVRTNSVGLSIECRNVNGTVIRNCQSFNDAAGPTLSNNSKNVVIENCYTFASYDDSFACLGNIPTTSAITFKNCIADKGFKAPSSVTASCFKLDSGGSEHGISGVTYINCKAYNAKPGRADIQGGFINGDPTVSNVKYINCSAVNCHVGIKVAGSNMKVMSSLFHSCMLQNCDIALVTEVRSPGGQFQDISFNDNKQDTVFYTPPSSLTKR
ncbi:MAG TPA: hypothetical protein VJ729_12540 [Nitrososphaeraceae archaeon]|nr:hypothetical protein [Nitrososphaeraceae archaeon]